MEKIGRRFYIIKLIDIFFILFFIDSLISLYSLYVFVDSKILFNHQGSKLKLRKKISNI